MIFLEGYIFENIKPTIIANAKEGASTSSSLKYGPMVSILETTNLKNITEIKPVIIDAIAPFSEYPFQKRDIIITGQNVAAIPDQPKIIIQNTFRSG